MNKFLLLLFFGLFTLFSWAWGDVETPFQSLPTSSKPIPEAISNRGVSWRGIMFTTNSLEGAALLKIPVWTQDQKKTAEKYLSERQCSALHLPWSRSWIWEAFPYFGSSGSRSTYWIDPTNLPGKPGFHFLSSLKSVWSREERILAWEMWCEILLSASSASLLWDSRRVQG